MGLFVCVVVSISIVNTRWEQLCVLFQAVDCVFTVLVRVYYTKSVEYTVRSRSSCRTEARTTKLFPLDIGAVTPLNIKSSTP